MAYNFKSIADVEVVAEPTESANVLIEENGVIKKAPKTAVGGGGGGGGSTEVITVIVNNNDYDDITAPNDLYNKIKEIFQTCALHLLNIYVFSPGGEYPAEIRNMNIHQIQEYDDFYYISVDNNNYGFDVRSNGELNFYYND